MNKALYIVFTLAIANLCSAYSESFINYLKKVEGFRSNPYYCAAGKLTIGYGHVIKQGEVYTAISERQATEILKKDLEAVKGRIKRKYGELSERNLEILTDYYFNLGSMQKFPKMQKAILDEDISTQRREYKRYCNGKELTGRNKAFRNRYL